MTVDAEGVMTARNTISMIFGASAETHSRWLIFIRRSAMSGTTIILKNETKYTLLSANIFFKSIPAKSIPVTIMLAGPIILPTDAIVLLTINGRRILVKKRITPIAIDIILIFNTIFFQS